MLAKMMRVLRKYGILLFESDCILGRMRDHMSGIKTSAIIEINQTASKYNSSIVIRIGTKHIDAKSILGLSVTLLSDQKYKLEIHGPDEEEAKADMLNVFSKHGLEIE